MKQLKFTALLFLMLTLFFSIGCGNSDDEKCTSGHEKCNSDGDASECDENGEWKVVADCTSGCKIENGNAFCSDIMPEPDDLEKNDDSDSISRELYELSDRKAADVTSDIVSANNEFALKIFKELDSEQNSFISPLSISIALAMTYNFSTGETEKAMRDSLGFSEFDLEGINNQFKLLIESLENADSDITLKLANSLWIDDSISPDEEALLTVAEFYDSKIATHDLQESGYHEVINSWIEENTGGKIKNMLGEITPEIIMYLINAIYFKANWQTTFDVEMTEKTDFTLLNGDKKSVDMMGFKETQEFKFYFDDEISAVRLPYGRDKVAFYGFVPKEQDVTTFIGNLTAEKLDTYMESFSENQLRVALPKFKFKYKKELSEILQKLGMESAFSGGLDKIDSGAYISAVLHQSFIEVDEKGTEAAAATAVAVGGTSAPEDSFNADKPFFFMIRDDRSGTILFMGTVTDPAEE